MEIFHWTADLATGNGMIDQDHRHLIALVNKLNDAMTGGKGNAVLGQVLDELIAEVQELRGKFAAGALTLSSKVYLFLSDRLNKRIKSADVRLAKAAVSA